MKQGANQLDLTEGAIFPKLMQLSIPLIFSSILQLLFNAADIVVVGKFASENSLAAVTSTSSLINLLVNLFVGLSVGANVVCSHYFGANKQKEVSQTVHTTFALSVISGIILTIFGVIGAKRILQLMHSPQEVLQLSTLYLQIYFAGITPTIIYNFSSAILRSKGDTKRPVYILTTAGIINFLLNLVFVLLLKMDVAGVAIATIISQIFASFCIISLLVKEKNEFHLNLKEVRINKEILLKILRIGIPAGLQGIVFSLSNVIIQSSINTFGKVVMTGSGAASNIECFVYTAMNGFAQGTLTFVSQNLGAKKINRIRQVTLISLGTVVVVGLTFGNLVVLFSKPLLKLYISNPLDIHEGQLRIAYICSVYFLCGIMDVFSNSIRGMGHSILPMIVSMTGACGTRILWLKTIFLLPKFHNPTTVYFSYPLSWTITALVHLICFIVIFTKIKKSNDTSL